MPIYQKESLGLVCDLINKSNVNLPFPVAPAIVSIGKPKALEVMEGSIVDTEVLLSALPTGPYYGSKRVKYRRIDLSKLFKGMNVEIRKYAPGPVTQVFHVSDLLLDINTRWGLSLTKSDLALDPWISPYTDNYYEARTSFVIVNIDPTSKAYSGSFKLRWVNGEPSLEDLTPITDIPGREFPGGNVFDSLHKEVLNTVAYGLDITSVVSKHNPVFFRSPKLYGSMTAHNDLQNFINAKLGTAYTFDIDNTGLVGNLYTASMKLYELPEDLPFIPEAKPMYYNRVLVIEPTDAQKALWCAGKLLLHFNE